MPRGHESHNALEEFWHTNYAAPDLALIEQIFDVFYRQRVAGEARHRFLRRHEVAAALASDNGIKLTLRDLNANRTDTTRYDAIVLATGYACERHKSLLGPLSSYLGDYAVDRHYRVQTGPEFHPAIFLQGACEMTHGLSDTLLSITAIRSGEIGKAVLNKVERHAFVAVKQMVLDSVAV
jgi:L-ornithine N5-oxygenase